LPTAKDLLVVLGALLASGILVAVGVLLLGIVSGSPTLSLEEKLLLKLGPVAVAAEVGRRRGLVHAGAFALTRHTSWVVRDSILVGVSGGALLQAILMVLSPGSRPESAMHSSQFSLMLAVVPLVLVGPPLEEVVFRWILLRAVVRRLPSYCAIAVSTILFASLHAPGWSMAAAVAVGIFSGAALLAGESLLPPIILHASWNAATIAARQILLNCGPSELATKSALYLLTLLLLVPAVRLVRAPRVRT
jgi:hypothetical protein